MPVGGAVGIVASWETAGNGLAWLTRVMMSGTPNAFIFVAMAWPIISLARFNQTKQSFSQAGNVGGDMRRRVQKLVAINLCTGPPISF